MGREQYKTPQEDVAVEFDRVCQLFQSALGKPSDRVLFDSLMAEASERGMNWIEGLQYVIERRSSGGEREAALGRRPVRSSSGMPSVSGQELRQAS